MRPLLALLLIACSPGPTPASDRNPDPTPTPTSPPDAGAPTFTIEPALDLQPAGTPTPATATFTSGGKLPPPAPEFAIVRVSSLPAAAPATRAKAARSRLSTTDLATEVKIDGQSSKRLDGLDGFATLAHGRHEKTPVTLHQIMLFDDSRTWVIEGRSSTERWTWYRAAFDKMAASFHRAAAE